MERIRVITNARKVASVAGAILLTYAMLWCIVIATMLLVGLWLHMVYFTGLLQGLDLDIPLKNFSARGINITMPKMTPFQFDNHDEINLEMIRMGAFTLYLAVMILSVFIFPQLIAGVLLLKATDPDIASNVAYRFVRRHQAVQRVLFSIELIFLIGLACSFANWPVIMFQSLTMIFALIVFLLLVISRHRSITEVDKFLSELWIEMRNGDCSCTRRQYQYKRLGVIDMEKAEKKEIKLGLAKIHSFAV